MSFKGRITEYRDTVNAKIEEAILLRVELPPDMSLPEMTGMLDVWDTLDAIEAAVVGRNYFWVLND